MFLYNIFLPLGNVLKIASSLGIEGEVTANKQEIYHKNSFGFQQLLKTKSGSETNYALTK